MNRMPDKFQFCHPLRYFCLDYGKTGMARFRKI